MGRVVNPWVPIIVLAFFALAWIALDIMYWVGYLDGKRAR